MMRLFTITTITITIHLCLSLCLCTHAFIPPVGGVGKIGGECTQHVYVPSVVPWTFRTAPFDYFMGVTVYNITAAVSRIRFMTEVPMDPTIQILIGEASVRFPRRFSYAPPNVWSTKFLQPVDHAGTVAFLNTTETWFQALPSGAIFVEIVFDPVIPLHQDRLATVGILVPPGTRRYETAGQFMFSGFCPSTEQGTKAFALDEDVTGDGRVPPNPFWPFSKRAAAEAVGDIIEVDYVPFCELPNPHDQVLLFPGQVSSPPLPLPGNVSAAQSYDIFCTAGTSVFPTLQCLPNGTWTQTAPCACSPPLLPLTNGQLVLSQDPFNQTVASFVCPLGFSSPGNPIASSTCDAGLWSPNPFVPEYPSCARVSCPPLLPLPGRITSLSNPVFQDVIDVSCVSGLGFFLKGASSVTCLANGTYSAPPGTCFVECPVIPPVLAGDFTCSGSASSLTPGSLGEVCNFTCDPGFSLVGTSPLITCTNTSEWSSPSFPFCSSFAIETSFAVGLPSSPHSPIAGSTLSFQVFVRDSSNAPALTGTDVPFVALSSVDPPSVPFPTPVNPFGNLAFFTYSGVDGVYDVDLIVPSVAYAVYNLSLGVNNIPFVIAPFELSLNVRPGLPSGPNTLLSWESTSPNQDAGTISLETGVSLPVVLSLRDALGNIPDEIPSGDDLVVSLRLSPTSNQILLPVSTSFDQQDFSLLVEEGGTYPLSLILYGVPVAGSPFLVRASTTCSPGSRVVDDVRCTCCSVGEYSEIARAESCTLCPEFSTTTSSCSSSWKNCTCLPSYWHGTGPRGPSVPCVPCPPGGVCLGGDASPQAAPGFQATETPGAFVSCPRAASCTGGPTCAPGYNGLLCSSCADGYYALGDECRRCSSATLAVVFLGAILVLAFVFAIVWINLRNTRVYGYAAFAISLQTVQAVAIYGSINLAWPASARALFNALSLLNLNLDLASPECGLSLTDPWVFKWAMTMALPLIFIPIFVFVVFVVSIIVSLKGSTPSAQSSYCAPSKPVWTAGGRGYLQLLLILYFPLIYTGFRYVDCTDLGQGIIVMSTNSQRRCYTDSWFRLLPLVLVVALVYAAGIPAGLWFFLRRRARALDTLEFAARYAFLVARYTQELYAYEVIILLRKLMVVFMVCVFQSPTRKAIFVAFVLFVLAAFNLIVDHRPYIERYHNILDNLTLLLSVLLLWTGTFASDNADLRGGLVLTTLIALLLVLLVFMAYEINVIRTRDHNDVESTLDYYGSHGFDNSGKLDAHQDPSDFDQASFSQNVSMDILDEADTDPATIDSLHLN